MLLVIPNNKNNRTTYVAPWTGKEQPIVFVLSVPKAQMRGQTFQGDLSQNSRCPFQPPPPSPRYAHSTTFLFSLPIGAVWEVWTGSAGVFGKCR